MNLGLCFFLLFIATTISQPASKTYFYSNDRKIQYLTNVLTHSSLFKKEVCRTQPSYPFLTINTAETTFSGIVMCNIHARQLIASEICLRWLSTLENLPQITKEMKLKVFYRANRMRDFAMTEEGSCVRKNQNGVDLNRNFPTEFNFYNVTKTSEIYPSDRPINQPFTICLNQMIESQRPDFFLDIHSGENAFYYQEGINNDKEVEILRNLNATFPGLHLKKITTLKKDGQSINGHLFADLKVRKQVPYSLLFQTYQGSTTQTDEDKACFERFNPTTSEQMNRVTDVWSQAMTSTVMQVIKALKEDKRK